MPPPTTEASSGEPEPSGTSESTEPSPQDGRHLLLILAAISWVIAVLLGFGLLGLIFLLPAVRRRARDREARCTKCRRHRVIGRVMLVGFVLILFVGAGVRIHADRTAEIRCDSHITASGEIVREPDLPLAESVPPVWSDVRRAVVAPVSGIALLGSQAAGMERCWGKPLKVAFWWPPRSVGGSTIGDTFVAWIPYLPKNSDTLEDPANRYVYGLGAESYVRFGPNIAPNHATEERLAEHETRHLNQWTALTLVGGPLAFPLAYYADSAFFPFARNHFERAAGLADGGYPIPSSYGPAPLWGLVAVLGIALLIAFRTRLRLLSRVLVGGKASRELSQPGRCPRHTTGWF